MDLVCDIIYKYNKSCGSISSNLCILYGEMRVKELNVVSLLSMVNSKKQDTLPPKVQNSPNIGSLATRRPFSKVVTFVDVILSVGEV